MKENILDQKNKIFANDPENMLSCIEEFPEQVKDCWSKINKLIIPAGYINTKNIIVLGMGGSAIGGDLTRSLVNMNAKVSIHICRDYDLPQFANSQTLVIASSFSGNTEETVSAFNQAIERGCKLLGITGGGEIENLCKKNRIPYFKINYKSQPRAALGYSLISIIGILKKLNIFEISDNDIKKAILEIYELHEKINLGIAVSKNQAKELAIKVQDYIPLIIGSGTLVETAHRYKTQINENAKQAAIHDCLPELNHNTIVGFDYPKNIKDNLFIIMLQSAYDHPRTKIRQQIMIEIMSKKKIRFETIMFAPSSSALAEMLKMIYFGDYLSYYMAVLNKVDPTPVEPIQFLKDKLDKYK